MTRRGTTLVETLVAAGLLSLVLGGLWAVARGVRGGEARTSRAVGLLGEAVTLRARLAADLHAAEVPPNVTRATFFPDIAPDGRSLSFLRTAPEGREVDEGVYVAWSLEGPPGEATLVREELDDDDAVTARREFRDVVCREGSFERVVESGEAYVIAEFLLSPRDATRPLLPVRLVAPLRPPVRLPSTVRSPYPRALLGLPARGTP